MTSNLRDLSEYSLPDSGPQSTLSVSLSTSSQTRSPSLAVDSEAVQIAISVRQIQSTEPNAAITIGSIRNIFDLSSIFDIGILALTNAESGKSIYFHSAAYSPTVRSNFKFTWGRDIRDSVEFVSIPSMESGDSLTLTFDLSIQMLRNLWARRFLKKTTAVDFPFTSPETWQLHFVSDDSLGYHHNGIVLWTWGDLNGELQGKKFEYPTETMYTLDVEANERMKMERMEGKYVQLHPNDSSDVECFIAVKMDTEGVLVKLRDREMEKSKQGECEDE